MSFDELVEVVGKGVDGVGVTVIVVGTAVALALYGIEWVRTRRSFDAYRRCRQNVGRAILLGLEFLVAGDIIRTVAISPTFRTVGVLAVIVLIRTFLSVTLELEIEGSWPWQRRSSPRRTRGEEPAAPGV